MKYGNNNVEKVIYIDSKGNRQNVYSLRRIIKEKDKADVIQIENLEYSHSSDISSRINAKSSFERDFAIVPQLEYTTIELKAKFDMASPENDGENKLRFRVIFTDGTEAAWRLYNTGVTFNYSHSGTTMNSTYTIPNDKIVEKLIYRHSTFGRTGQPNTARLYGTITMKGTR